MAYPAIEISGTASPLWRASRLAQAFAFFPISLSLLAPLEIKREPQQERETEYECVS